MMQRGIASANMPTPALACRSTPRGPAKTMHIMTPFKVYIPVISTSLSAFTNTVGYLVTSSRSKNTASLNAYYRELSHNTLGYGASSFQITEILLVRLKAMMTAVETCLAIRLKLNI